MARVLRSIRRLWTMTKIQELPASVHFFICRICKRQVQRPGHLKLRTLICYECRRKQ